MRLGLRRFSYRFAEQVLNSKLVIKNEIEEILINPGIEIPKLSRPDFNKALKKHFLEKGWKREMRVFGEPGIPSPKIDFFKQRVGVEVAFTHGSFIGMDLLKLQVASYSSFDIIDVGVMVVTTKDFQNRMRKDYNLPWEGSLPFNKLTRYLPQFKTAIQVPIYVLGLEIIP